jgi:hypothetical protein
MADSSVHGNYSSGSKKAENFLTSRTTISFSPELLIIADDVFIVVSRFQCTTPRLSHFESPCILQ